MPTIPSPAFGINGGSPGVKFAATAGQALTATLDNIAGVSPVTWAVNSTDDTKVAADYPLTPSGSVNQTVAWTAGVAGTAGELRVTVAGGIDPRTEQPSTTMEYSCKWYVPTAEGLEVLTAGELEDDNRLGSATHGAVEAINAVIRNGGRLGDWKPSVRIATTAALAAHTRSGNVLTANANGAFPAIDGVTLALNEFILVKNEAAGHLEHGAYYLSQVGDGSNPWKLTRATWMDASAEVTAMCLIPVEEGTVNGDQVFALTTNNPITLNTTALTFTNFGVLIPLVTAAARGIVNSLGAASTVLTTDGATAGGAWAKLTPSYFSNTTGHYVFKSDAGGVPQFGLIINGNIDGAAGIDVAKLAVGTANYILKTTGATNAWALLVNANVDAAAAIDGTKISPNFGAQDITTTGVAKAGGANPATAGSIRLPNAGSIWARNAANTQNVRIGEVDSSNNIFLGDNSQGAATYVDCPPASTLFFRSSSSTIVTFSYPSSVSTFEFPQGVSGATIKTAIKTADVATVTTTVQSQSALASAATNVDGGKLHLQSGAAKTNGTTGLRGPIRIQLGADTSGTIIEAAEVAVGRRAVGLCHLTSGLTTTELPANTGDGVVFVANAATNPSANSVGGGLLYSNAGAGTWRGTGGTVTAFGPAGLHCSKCGYDSWRVAAVNTQWKSWHFDCGHCNAFYKGGPKSVLELLTEDQRQELITDAMGWDEVAALMKVDGRQT